MDIKIKDKEYPFLSGRGALRLYAREKGVSNLGNQELTDLLEKLSMDDSDLLYWCCLKAGCSQKGEKFPFSFEEFQEVLTQHPHLVDELDDIAVEQAPKSEKKKKAGKG